MARFWHFYKIVPCEHIEKRTEIINNKQYFENSINESYTKSTFDSLTAKTFLRFAEQSSAGIHNLPQQVARLANAKRSSCACIIFVIL